MRGVPFGDYLLLGRLAAGGMAEVFLAKGLVGPAAEQLYAVKRTLPHLAEHAEVLSMFADEARIISSLNHGNIATIYDRGGTLGQLYIVMEFVHGRDLQGVRRRARRHGKPLGHALIAYVVARIASALDYAHRRKDQRGRPRRIVHRDVSPQNILISYQGEPKLIDFGIAKARDRMAETQSGVLKGKYNYMSPEQARGERIDWRTDIYALGVTLYELLTGKLPFAANTRIATLQNAARGDYTPPRQISAGIPRALARVIDCAMAVDRRERYQAAAEMRRDLELFVRRTGEPADGATLARTMRDLFANEYLRELDQLAELSAIEPPPEAVAAVHARFAEVTEVDARPPWLEADDTTTSAGEFIGADTTLVHPSPELAAGYPVDGPMSEESDTVCETPSSWGAASTAEEAAALTALEPERSATDFNKEIGQSTWQQTTVADEVRADEAGNTLIIEMPDFLEPDDAVTVEITPNPFGDDEPTK